MGSNVTRYDITKYTCWTIEIMSKPEILSVKVVFSNKMEEFQFFQSFLLFCFEHTLYYESSSDDDEMIHTTASRKEVRNTILFKFIMISIVQYKQHDFYCSTCIFCNIIPCYIASHQRVSCLSYWISVKYVACKTNNSNQQLLC